MSDGRAGVEQLGPQPGAPEGFQECIRCGGDGEHVECYDDLCHAQGRCLHGNNTCALCRGHRFISAELADRWRACELGEYVTLPDADRDFRGVTA